MKNISLIVLLLLAASSGTFGQRAEVLTFHDRVKIPFIAERGWSADPGNYKAGDILVIHRPSRGRTEPVSSPLVTWAGRLLIRCNSLYASGGVVLSLRANLQIALPSCEAPNTTNFPEVHRTRIGSDWTAIALWTRPGGRNVEAETNENLAAALITSSYQLLHADVSYNDSEVRKPSIFRSRPAAYPLIPPECDPARRVVADILWRANGNWYWREDSANASYGAAYQGSRVAVGDHVWQRPRGGEYRYQGNALCAPDEEGENAAATAGNANLGRLEDQIRSLQERLRELEDWRERSR